MDSIAIMEQLMTSEGRAEPYPLYAQARELGAVTACGEGMIMVTGYQEVNEVLRDGAFQVADAELRSRWEEGFNEHSSKIMLSRSILERNEPDHSRMRSLIASVFTARRIAALEPAVVAATHRLLDEMAGLGADGTPVDFMETFAYRLPVGVICELLGVPEADRHRFRTLAADLTAALEVIAGDPELDAADAAAEELAGYFTGLAAERKARPKDDLVSALVQVAAADPARLSGHELLANLVLLLVAGFETTTNLLGNGLSLLLDHPEALAGLRSGEISPAGYTDEVLRFDSPVQVTSRVSIGNGLRIGGLDAPYGYFAFLLIGAANRDPQRYEHPERFDPTRRDSRPLSFGGGPHYCLGAQLARLESAVAMPALLARFPHLARAGEPVRRDRWVLRGYQSLPLTLGR
ncbi:cytochrome P450 [Kitasatospora sp. McL0602]|uniref:cytochrome P450 n=1 Tax=Kitasatospora sp. McL0602 TaxID=3439530 RepID=UPI003F8B17A5